MIISAQKTHDASNNETLSWKWCVICGSAAASDLLASDATTSAARARLTELTSVSRETQDGVPLLPFNHSCGERA